MIGKSPNLGLPRKVVACYLLFCLIAICWLALGVWFTSHSVLNSHSVNSCLARLGKTASAIEISYLRHGKQDFAKLLEQAKAEGRFAYCSIAGPDGTYWAHTNAQMQGEPVVEPTGCLLRWGSVTGIRFTDNVGQSLGEYQVPLTASTEPIGTLRIAVIEPNVWNTFGEVARHSPLTILIPLALVGLGAVMISRLTSSVADIDSQLRKIAELPPGTEVSLAPLPATDAATLGWNHLASSLKDLRNHSTSPGLDDRLTKAVASRKQSELAEILHNLSDGIAVTDPEGRITFANRAIAALLGTEAEEGGLEGADLADCFTRDLPELSHCTLFDPSMANRPVVSEVQRGSEQAERVLRVARQPLQDATLKGQVWSLRDVTQQKLADKMREQFIDTATHELRTPLSNIKAYAEMLATCDTIEVEQQKEFCNTINSEVTRLARFVDDLLSISSMEVGSISAERQKVETSRLFEEVLSKVQPLMQQKDLDFEVHLPEKMQELQLDKDKIVAVLVNLLGNAAKYTPTGGHVALKVNLDESKLHIAVEDSGVGISSEELPMVFEKFFRSSDERVQAESGTGLGLSLAREVVRMHGGDILVESTLNQGSNFLVTIPLE